MLSGGRNHPSLSCWVECLCSLALLCSLVMLSVSQPYMGSTQSNLYLPGPSQPPSPPKGSPGPPKAKVEPGLCIPTGLSRVLEPVHLFPHWAAALCGQGRWVGGSVAIDGGPLEPGRTWRASWGAIPCECRALVPPSSYCLRVCNSISPKI